MQGLTALATSLKTAGKVVPLIIAGHAHATLSTPLVVGNTMLVEAGYSGGYVGQVPNLSDFGLHL